MNKVQIEYSFYDQEWEKQDDDELGYYTWEEYITEWIYDAWTHCAMTLLTSRKSAISTYLHFTDPDGDEIYYRFTPYTEEVQAE